MNLFMNSKIKTVSHQRSDRFILDDRCKSSISNSYKMVWHKCGRVFQKSWDNAEIWL